MPEGGNYLRIIGNSDNLTSATCARADGTFTCTLNPAEPLAPGDTVWIDVEVNAPEDQINRGALNCAELVPGVHVADPGGNNRGCAPFALPQPVIGPLPQDLGIEKFGPSECTAGGTCSYAVRITNHGPGRYEGPLQVVDLPTGAEGVVFAGASPGWDCTQAGSRITCNRDAVILNEGATLTLTLNFTLPAAPGTGTLENCTWLGEGTGQLERRGGLRERFVRLAQLGNTQEAAIRLAQTKKLSMLQDRNSANNRSCVSTTIVGSGDTVAPQVPQCRSGWKRFRTAAGVPAGWSRYALQKGGRTIAWCARRKTVPPQCRSGWKRFKSAAQVPAGWSRYALRVGNRTVAWCAKSKTVAAQCRKGWKRFKSAAQVPAGWSRYALRVGNRTVGWCAKRKTVAAQCRKGWKRFKSAAQVPAGWRRYALKVGNRTVAWCAKGRTTVPRCRAGWKRFKSAAQVPAGWRRYALRVGNRTVAWCAKRKAQRVERCVGGTVRAGRCICPPNTRRTRPARGVVACKPRVTKKR